MGQITQAKQSKNSNLDITVVYKIVDSTAQMLKHKFKLMHYNWQNISSVHSFECNNFNDQWGGSKDSPNFENLRWQHHLLVGDLH